MVALQSFARLFIKITERCCAFCFALSAFACTALVLLIFYQVITRYLFSTSSVALQELQWHLFGFIIMLSIATTLRQDQHVRVDILYSRFSAAKKRVVDLLSYLSGMLIAAILVYYGWRYAATALRFDNPFLPDHFSSRWWQSDGMIYQISSVIESVLRNTILIGEVSADPGGLEARWIIKSIIPFGGLLLFFQSLALLLGLLLNKAEDQS